MEENKKKFLDLVVKFEQLKNDLKAVGSELNTVMADIGVGTYIQDPDSLVVHKIVVPTGTFVEFKTIGYERTVKEGEKRGSLSKKEAEEAGFSLK
jgi:hypothetical protein